ncbi:hypothetical protein COCON_G00121820 [Conger conger]|uniref:Uncharacterized protein n=1 Tax=Conger conger TaxID=82655 RepID=A0A9Q1HY73_CONCO|nr:hypothetical protein COCON_G00121820 [Conger conger]
MLERRRKEREPEVSREEGGWNTNERQARATFRPSATLRRRAVLKARGLMAGGEGAGSKNAKPFSSSDSLAKVQEVASWLLEMNSDLLGGAGRRRRPGGAGRGDSASSTRQPREAGEGGEEEEEHMDRVLEEEEQQQRRASEGPGASDGPQGPGTAAVSAPGEAEVNGEPGKGAAWAWQEEQDNNNEEEEPQEEEEEEEGRGGGGG